MEQGTVECGKREQGKLGKGNKGYDGRKQGKLGLREREYGIFGSRNGRMRENTVSKLK